VRVLILGGTTEASALARALVERGEDVITSFAGRTASARAVAGATRIGGFGGAEGLAAHLRDEGVDVLLDATHPFAPQMRWHARAAGEQAGVPTLRVERPGWAEEPGDRWQRVPSLAAAATAAAGHRRVFLTTGRTELPVFEPCTETWFLIRTVEPVDAPPGRDSTVIQARGPFALDDERALLDEHRIEAVVTKDSGGDATRAKLLAARERSLPVIVVDRPPNPPGPRVETVAEALAWLDSAGV
jgi:precorrin-6A/cobalt-precorrin-6A reductase